jgi:hypothetical protein
MPANPYLAEYRTMLAHQETHGKDAFLLSFPGRPAQPMQYCYACMRKQPRGAKQPDDDTYWNPLQRRYAWGIPNEPALAAIAEHSPNGVVEIGAGGGYWAKLLRDRGVDVLAFDPEPGNAHWSLRTWSEVLRGDHTSVIGFPERTLLLVWPSYSMDWTDKVIDLYGGQTVIYVGEGSGGCTGTERMHQLLGEDGGCWHFGGEDDPCDCEPVDALFTAGKVVDIPQWFGIHDYLTVFHRKGVVA